MVYPTHPGPGLVVYPILDPTNIRHSSISAEYPSRKIIKSSEMEAVQYVATGGVDVIKVNRVSVPTLKPGHVLVKNYFAGVNMIDTYFRSGLYKADMPMIPGREASGQVEAVGDGVNNVKPGDHVVYLHTEAFAEKTLVPADKLIHLPNGISYEHGVAAHLQGLTALTLTKLCHPVRKGDYVLVHAAAGGTGRIIAGLSKHYGAHVIGTTSTKEKAETAKAAGCHDVILYTEQDVAKEVMRITNGKGVNAVFDGVGRSTFDISLACCTKLATFASFGNSSGAVPPVDLFKLSAKAIRLMRPRLDSFLDDKESYKSLSTELYDLIAQKVITILIHKRYALTDVAQAQLDLEGRKTAGKLLIDCRV